MKIAVVGCSFAGLSFAHFLNKTCPDIDLTLFDRKKEVGLNRTSACCVPTKTLRELSLENSILRRFNLTSVYYKNERMDFRHPEYATFDYYKFCNTIIKGIDAEFNMGSEIVLERIKNAYDVVIDCTGWSSKIDSKKRLFFGIEREAMIKGIAPQKLHIFLGKDIVKDGYGWIFPTTRGMFRVGIGSCKKMDFAKVLDDFLSKFDYSRPRNTTGGFISYGLTKKMFMGNVICLGDSASQTLPVTMEGIRPTIFYSKILSNLISKYHMGKITFNGVLECYKKANSMLLYRYLLGLQGLAFNMNDVSFKLFFGKNAKKHIYPNLKDYYILKQ